MRRREGEEGGDTYASMIILLLNPKRVCLAPCPLCKPHTHHSQTPCVCVHGVLCARREGMTQIADAFFSEPPASSCPCRSSPSLPPHIPHTHNTAKRKPWLDQRLHPCLPHSHSHHPASPPHTTDAQHSKSHGTTSASTPACSHAATTNFLREQP